MFRHAMLALVGLFLVAGSLLAADKEVKGKVVKVDVITVMTEDGKKDYEVSKDTKFLGPKGGASEKGMEDDRLVPGAEVTLKIAGNNRTIHEVRLPERKGKGKP
jgi:hypothetical protein